MTAGSSVVASSQLRRLFPAMDVSQRLTGNEDELQQKPAQPSLVPPRLVVCRHSDTTLVNVPETMLRGGSKDCQKSSVAEGNKLFAARIASHPMICKQIRHVRLPLAKLMLLGPLCYVPAQNTCWKHEKENKKPATDLPKDPEAYGVCCQAPVSAACFTLAVSSILGQPLAQGLGLGSNTRTDLHLVLLFQGGNWHFECSKAEERSYRHG